MCFLMGEHTTTYEQLPTQTNRNLTEAQIQCPVLKK